MYRQSTHQRVGFLGRRFSIGHHRVLVDLGMLSKGIEDAVVARAVAAAVEDSVEVGEAMVVPV